MRLWLKLKGYKQKKAFHTDWTDNTDKGGLNRTKADFLNSLSIACFDFNLILFVKSVCEDYKDLAYAS